MLVSIWLAFPAQAAAVSGDPDGGFGLGSGSAMLETGDYLSHSKAGILYEATTDTVIYAKNADMQLPPASMTKVMTAILVLTTAMTLAMTTTLALRLRTLQPRLLKLILRLTSKLI